MGATTDADNLALPAPSLPRTNEGKRICQVIKVKPEALDEYKKVSIAEELRGRAVPMER